MSPVIGNCIIEGRYGHGLLLLSLAGLSDYYDGHLARKYNWKTPIGSVLDPAADKILITTLVTTMVYTKLIPLGVGIVIIGRDVYLTGRSLFIRYKMLQHPKTFARFWDSSVSPAEITPSWISKINTALQLSLMGTTLFVNYLGLPIGLEYFHYVVLGTTIWSAIDYTRRSNFIKIKE